MGLVIDNFMGELPGVSDQSKPIDAAAKAVNVLVQGDLVPWSFTSTVDKTLSNDNKAVVRIDGITYTIPAGSVALSPVVNDLRGRVYYTYDTAPTSSGRTAYVVNSKGTDGQLLSDTTNVRVLGVAIPNTPNITVTHTTLTPPDKEVGVSTYYACTLTNMSGEEGALSSPSNNAVLYSNSTVVIARPAGISDTYIKSWNIYMANDGQWQLLVEVPYATSSYTLVGDAAKYPPLGETCPSMDWEMPPADLKGLVPMAGGFMAGYSGRSICFSEAYLPHAWPPMYSLPTQYDILGIVPVNNGAVVITTGRQYLVTGSQPSTMQMQQLEMDAGCVSRDSIVDMGDYAIYASHLGLVKLGLDGIELISEQAFPRYYWGTLSVTTIKAMRLKHYYVFAVGGTTYVLDTGTKQITRTDKINVATLYRGFYDATNDRTYVINTSKQLLSVGLSAATGAEWESRPLANNNGVAPSFGQVDADTYPLTLTVRTSNDGTTYTDKAYTVTKREPFRLAAGRARFMKAKLTNFTGRITRLVLTNNREEFL